MAKALTNCPVASTPYNIKDKVQGYLADILPELSPISQHVTAPGTTKDTQPSAFEKENGKVRGKRLVGKFRPHTVLPTKTKSDSSDKESGVEQSVTQSRCNTLSHSLNKYNLYPEPILLDSEDENSIQVITVTRKNVTRKKPSGNAGADKDPKTKINKRKIVENCDENETPAKMKESKETVQAQSLPARQTSSKINSKAKGKLVLENVTNASLEEKARKRIKRPKLKQSSVPDETPTPFLKNDDEDLFSTYLPLRKIPESVKKRINTCSVVEISDDDIKWTPRRTKIRNSCKRVDHDSVLQEDKVESTPQDEEFDKLESVSDGEKAEKLGIVSSGEQAEKLESASFDKEANEILEFSKASTLVSPEANPVKQKFPEECVSEFKEVIFRRNKGSGGLVAQCFQTSRNKFGYIEVEEGKVFTGRQKNITFFVLEGSMKASQLDATQILGPGDALHINIESEYKFVPSGAGHVRLLFVKEK